MNPKSRYALIIAVSLGLFTQLLPVFTFTPHSWITATYDIIRYLSPNYNLNYFSLHLFYHTNSTTHLTLNFLDLGMFMLMFIGLILHTRSRGKEIRLLRMTVSLLLLAKIIGLLSMLISVFTLLKTGWSSEFKWSMWVLAFISTLSWLYIAYYILTDLSRGRGLHVNPAETDDEGRELYLETPKAQRFAHHIIDLLFSIFLFARFLTYYLSDVFEFMAEYLGERTVLYTVVILSRVLYLVFFEVIFGATPAKFLTESRVIMQNGNPLRFNTGLLRSLTRHVPFEVLSYLGQGNGWHDKWNDTLVVKEVRTGVAAKKYVWLLAALLGIGLLSYLGYEANDRYQSFKRSQARHNHEITILRNELMRLNVSHVIEISPAKRFSRSEDRRFLKVEEVFDSNAYCTVFNLDDYSPTNLEIERYYQSNKETFATALIHLSELHAAITPEYRKYKNYQRNTAELLGDGQEYQIDNIYTIFGPAISLGGSSSYGNGQLSLGLLNEGWKAQLIAIETLEGDLEWSNLLPQEINPPPRYSSTSMSIHATNFEYGKNYKFVITVQDSLGSIQRYLIQGRDGDKTIEKQ